MEPNATRLCRILVVEDDWDNGTMLMDALRTEGYAPSLARDGADALHCLATMRSVPNLILLDLAMPSMDGATFARHLRQQPAWRAIPIIVLSAWRDAALIAEQVQAIEFIAKPFDLTNLLDTVASYCPQETVA